MSECTICNRADRIEIEQAILNLGSDPELSIESIAEQFQCSQEDLKMHALFHCAIVGVELGEDDNAKTSIVRQSKLKELDALATMNTEYMTTLKAMGRRLQRLVSVSSIDVEDEDKLYKLSKLLTKPMVDMYVGLGNEIRQNVKTMAEIDRLINGKDDSTVNGLAALAEAIKGSST